MVMMVGGALGVCAQQVGSGKADSMPYSMDKLRSWNCVEKQGDLNKDGIGDLVIVATPDFKELVIVNEVGDTIDTNKPVLAIFFGNERGGWDLVCQYDDVIPISESKYHFIDYVVDVTDKGVLTVDLDYFSSMGSWGKTNKRYLFRYQDGDFYLIGEDDDTFMRNSGEATKTSINYLTAKKQVVTSNVFDEKVKPKERWAKIPRQPLRPLGTWTLGD